MKNSKEEGNFNICKALKILLLVNYDNYSRSEYIKKSSNNRYNLDNIFFTNAIMRARKGNNYRGSNINLKKSTINCSKYLLKQIEIVNPKVILTLGYYPLLSLSNIFNFKI